MKAKARVSSRLAVYAPEQRVGVGATSEVWRARAPGGRRVALKIARDPAHHARLADEAERLLGADSPALAGVLDAGVSEGRGWVALDWAEGEPLDALLSRPAAERRKLALAVARDVSAALSDLHALGVAHGDVKPANIVADRTRLRARLVDLGLSAAADEQTARGGTLRYLDPNPQSDARTRDLWALGITLAELASPAAARAKDAASAARAARLPAALSRIVRALTAPEPGARPSADWVRRQLDREALAERAVRARRAVRRSYLAVRRAEIVGQRSDARLGLAGEPRFWVQGAVELLNKINELRGSSRGCSGASLGDLDALGRARWLVALVGPAAAHWPELGVANDAELAARLLAACEHAAPESFTLPMLTGGSAPAARERDPIELALLLASGNAPVEAFDAAERLLADDALPALGLALARSLRLRGEIGRALAVLERIDSPDAAAEAAECARRGGDLAGARARAESVRSPRATAILARLELDAGRPDTALALLASAPDTPAVCEARALAELAAGDRAAARSAVERGRLLAASDEERARLEAAAGYAAHFDGDAERALARYRRAAEHAARAGAVLEEASYLTGVAANATHVGELGEALTAAERAILLFEHLGRARDAARAALSRASVFAIAGAVHAARDAAEDAIARARRAGDRRCRAYAHLALADVLAVPEAGEHAERAGALLADPDPDDALRVAARRLRAGGALDPGPLDQSAREPSRALDARLEWWGARAEALARAPEVERAEAVLTELGVLAAVRAPIAVRGPALSAGAALAARVGDGDGARRLAQASREAARELIRRAPRELRASLEQRPWIQSLHSPRESSVSPEQLTDIETLVRALGRRDRLRPLLDQVLDALVLWTGVERGLLLLRAPGERLVVRAARNLARADLDQRQLELSFSLAARALEQGEPVVAVDAAGELPEVHASVHALKLRSVLAVPLHARGEALGVVYLDDRVRRGAFGPRELGWVRLVATIASVAIADARDQLLLRRAARRAERAEQRLGEELARREAALDVAERELARSRGQRNTRFSYDSIVGTSEPLLAMLRLLDKVCAAEIPVLVVGESGSGKELVARAIHRNSPRRAAPFVSENCSAIPEPLLESTLFGHVRGAFTGASRPRAGLFEVADGGTLFLDEIGEMSLGMQTKLLRVLEDGEVRAVGSERSRKVNVRVIGATHRNLEALVEAGEFRQDLFFRLNVITLQVPALRERPTDIPLLVDYFVSKHAPGPKKIEVSRAALDALVRFPWPGNVRQLENEIRRAIVLAEGAIEIADLSPELRGHVAGRPAVTQELNVRERVDALEAELVSTALMRTGGNQTRAAELLGLSRFGLQKMLKRLEIDPRRSRS